MIISNLKLKAQEMKTNLGVLYLAFKDNRTPWYAKALIGIIIAYALSPIDLIPDFIPILGYLDDLILVPVGIALAIKLIPQEVFQEYRENIDTFPRIKINGIYGVIIIVAIWSIIIYLTIKVLTLN